MTGPLYTAAAPPAAGSVERVSARARSKARTIGAAVRAAKEGLVIAGRRGVYSECARRSTRLLNSSSPTTAARELELISPDGVVILVLVVR